MNLDTYVEQLDIKVTPLRKSILSILWKSKAPVKAYMILETLSKVKQNAKPPTVYRVLDFLVENGIAHKISSTQSYTLCHHPKQQIDSEILMVCNNCNHIIEVIEPVMTALINKLTKENHFLTKENTVEIKGLCEQCTR